MRKLFILLFSIFLSLNTMAQLKVKEGSFKEVDGFVNINTEKMFDDNDKPYAVLKVKTENINDKQRRELLFQGDARTFIECEYKVGEVWLYISYYASYLKISHPDLSSTEFWFPYDMKPKCGYELTLVNKTIDGEDILNRLERLENANANVYETSINTTSAEIIKRGDYYYYNQHRLTKNEYKELLKDCPEAWATYKKGKIWKTVGWVCAIGGTSCLIVEFIKSNSWAWAGDGSAGWAGIGIGAFSVPSFIIGNRNINNAYKEYNQHCVKPVTISMGVTQNGFGLVLNF